MTPPLEDRLTALLALRGLQPLGAFAPTDDDDLSGIKSVVMIAPAPDFWTQFTASHEWQGGLPDPMDRWSQRVIGRLALELDAKAYFPFTGPPYRPFYSWAQRAGQSYASPVTLLISAAMGLDTSFRGALGLRETVDFGSRVTPCDTCEAPCKSACPADALTTEGYDVPKCKAYLDHHPDSPCRTQGCAVRRACPAGPGQPVEQALYHLDQFRS